ncbi:hypothetical protein [Kribbella sp. CA-293567]|uniref:hypothetical protein n=1 Tax=Kribbella sp. CA-293567 TaxID=3002436 RepID=UPI0022DDB58F|nr:hypothetical protein [Kribbella sp. CA-293567]WBQ04481.1 hypothetical protein OX958_31525 [Kribbella sp. CA-293567]
MSFVRVVRGGGVAGVAAMVLAGVPVVAQADKAPVPVCSSVLELDQDTINVKLCHTSDVDQHWYSLPKEGGAYCGPATLFNVLHHFNRRKGAPVRIGGGVPMTEVDPRDPADTTETKDWLTTLGTWSKITSTGTQLSELRKAFNTATVGARLDGWTTATGGVPSTGPNALGQSFGHQLASKLTAGPAQILYGRYKQVYGGVERDGGHMVTVIAANYDLDTPDTIKLTVYDPARAADKDAPTYLISQSQYQAEQVTLKKKVIHEYLRPADDPDTVKDESLTLGTWRWIERWHLTGPSYEGTTEAMVEGFNWFSMYPPQ